jgi:hypothetical protein
MTPGIKTTEEAAGTSYRISCSSEVGISPHGETQEAPLAAPTGGAFPLQREHLSTRADGSVSQFDLLGFCLVESSLSLIA